MPLATTLLPDAVGDLWSASIALLAFALFFLFLKGLERV
jgi:hypothetical protein